MRFSWLLLAVILAAGAAQAQTVTVTLKGKLALMKNGALVSNHNTERDAVEKAINSGPGTYRIVQPDIEIVVAKPVVISSIECATDPIGCNRIAYYPPCVTGDCRKPTHAEQSAVRARIAENTAAWAALPGNREKMGWHDQMWNPAP